MFSGLRNNFDDLDDDHGMALALSALAVSSALDSTPGTLASARDEVVIGVANSVTKEAFWNKIPSASTNDRWYMAEVGDKLTFRYGDHHNVYHAADEAAWNSCSTTGGEEVGGYAVGGGDAHRRASEGDAHHADYSNLYQSVVTTAGDYYFFCSHSGHCEAGQKIKVRVTDVSPSDSAASSTARVASWALGVAACAAALLNMLP